MRQQTIIVHLRIICRALLLLVASLTLATPAHAGVSGTTTATPGVLGVSPDTSKTWEFIGPNNTIVSNPNTPLGIGGIAVAGRVNAVSYDPLNSNILYAATANGGIWKSINKGQQWIPLSLANPYGYAFSCVTVDPTDDTVVYAGTGDYDGANNLGFGIIKFKFTTATATASTAYSIDTTFLATSKVTFGQRCIRQITIDPTNHLHIFVAGGRDQSINAIRQYSQFVKLPLPAPQPNYPDGGIWSTTNGGVSWPNTLSTQLYFSNIVYAYNANPKAAPNSQVLYASADFGGVFKSIDNGNTWSYLNSLFTQLFFINPTKQNQVQPSSTWRVDVACSPVNANTLYIMSEFNQAIYKSTDGGNTFTTISNSLPTTDPMGNATWGNASYDLHIACSKAVVSSTGAPKQTSTTYDVVYAGLIDLFQSPQGIDSWQPTGFVNSGNDLMHPTQHRVAISPFNVNEISIANEGGAYKLVYSPTISNYSFTSLNATLGNMELLGGAFGFTDPTQALLVSQNSGNPHYDGVSANWSNPGPTPAWFSAINPEVAPTQYVSSTFTFGGARMHWSEDDWVQTFGTSDLPADNPANGISPPNAHAPVVMDLYNPDLLYFGQQDVWQGVHTPGTPAAPGIPPVIGTLTWTSQGVLLTNPDVDPVSGLTDGDTIVALAVSQFDNKWLYASTRDGLFWYANNTSNWLRQDAWYEDDPITGDLVEHHNNGIPRGTVTAFATSTKKPKKLYAAFNIPPTFNRQGVQLTPQMYTLEVCNDVTASFIDQAGVRVPTCSFSSISGSGATALPNVPINSIQDIPHDNDSILVVGTNAGVYITTNGGTSWTNISNDGAFPSGLVVTHVRYEPSTSYLYATTNGRGVWAKYIPNDPILGPLFKSTFSLYPTLQEYRGNRAKLGIAVKFFGGGQPINGKAPAGAPAIPQPYEYELTTLSSSGWWIDSVSVNGAFDIWFKVNGFLSVRMTNTQVGANTLVSPLVYAGDCNPIYDANGAITSYGDNVIDINDLNEVLAHLGQIWTGPADVDGDGVVTARDLAIVQANQGMRGAP